MERLICLAVGYVCGLFQTGYLVGKMNHIDIRKREAEIRERQMLFVCSDGKRGSSLFSEMF